MTKIKKRIANPMTVIAIFATLSETSAAVSLPFLDNKEREIYVWFLISFPFYLLLLFFVTLNFNYRSLYAPSDFEKGKHFIKVMDNNEHAQSHAGKTKRNAPAERRRASAPRPAKPPPVEIDLQGTSPAQQQFRLSELLKEMYIIDARWMRKKIEFRALLEKLQRPEGKQKHVTLFLTSAESEKALKNGAAQCSRQTRKRKSVNFFVAYNLNSHEVTVIDQNCQAT
jgi:hypothetical protein